MKYMITKNFDGYLNILVEANSPQEAKNKANSTTISQSFEVVNENGEKQEVFDCYILNEDTTDITEFSADGGLGFIDIDSLE